MRCRWLLTTLVLTVSFTLAAACDSDSGGDGGKKDIYLSQDSGGYTVFPDSLTRPPEDSSTPQPDGTSSPDTGVDERDVTPAPDGCVPDCEGKVCGDNGCGGSCGECGGEEACEGGQCVPCQPDCEGKECGPDGCGGECGPGCDLAARETCQAGECMPCQPNCEGKNCGDDGCGGECGRCDGQYEECDEHIGRCVIGCVPNCAGRECGPNGCGGTCPPNDCGAEGMVCNTALGWCQETCEPACDGFGYECGTDGCGGTCGTCPAPKSCWFGHCVDRCIPQCEGKVCGDNGCEGRCGYCPAGEGCENGGCVPLPLNCPGILDCSRNCTHNDQACFDACRTNGRASSRSLYDGLISCRDTNCSGMVGTNLSACLKESCSGQLTSCGLDFLCGDPGMSDCMAVQGCVSSCGSHKCVNDCVCSANDPSKSAATAWATCVVQNCPALSPDCMSEVGGMMGMGGPCSAQWMACMGGGTPF